MKESKFPQQIVSLAILFTILISSLIVARILLVPESFGKYGHYRANAVDEIKALEINYAGALACHECHEDIVDEKARSNHRNVSCEVCHGAAARHTEAPDEFTPGAPRGRGHCPLCHGYDRSRPTGFPQIITELHNPGKACMTCHEPHNPLLPHTPEECSACHREISIQKKVSPHESLECTRCHVATEQHLVTPRFALAQKPMKREFCGECHSKGASSPKDILKIDLDTHYERYLCWDCHYPHHPEAR